MTAEHSLTGCNTNHIKPRNDNDVFVSSHSRELYHMLDVVLPTSSESEVLYYEI